MLNIASRPSFQSLGIFFAVWLLAPWLLACLSLSAQAQSDARGNDQITEATVQAVEIANSNFSNESLTIRRRTDLDDLLLNVEDNNSTSNIYFYEMQAPPRKDLDSPSVWVVAVARSPRGVYDVYNFDAAEGPDAPLQEFNRLVSKLDLAIPKGKATGFARLFLEACGAGEGKEIVAADADGLGLRFAAENYYFAAYGDVWRALDAYALWWQGYQEAAASSLGPTFAPTTGADDNGNYRVALQRLVMIAGRQPQVQDLNLEVSPAGNVRVLAMQPIFPQQPRLLFYDHLRTTPMGFQASASTVAASLDISELMNLASAGSSGANREYASLHEPQHSITARLRSAISTKLASAKKNGEDSEPNYAGKFR